MQVCGCERRCVQVCVRGFAWVCTGVRVYAGSVRDCAGVQECLGVQGCARVYAGVCESARVCSGVRRYAGVRRCSQVCAGVHGKLWNTFLLYK